MTGSPPHPVLLHDVLDQAVARRPHESAVTVKNRTLSYAELALASRHVAHRLRSDGVGRGDRFLLDARLSPVLPVLVFAASRIGAVFSLIHEQVRGVQLEHILDDSEPTLFFSDAQPSLDVAAQKGVRTISSPDVTPQLDTRDAAEPEPAAGPLAVDPACMIYTSGTTSLPKAVVSTHQQMVFAAQAIQQVLRYNGDDVVYSPLPLSFDYGLYQLFLSALGGSHLHLGTPGDAGPALVTRLTRCRATILPGVPSMAEGLAALLRRRPGHAPQTLRMLTNTGAAMAQQTLSDLRTALPRLRVHLMFGLTECKRATIMPVDGDLTRPGSSGRALPGTEVFVIGEDGRRCPPGETGEIVVRGPHVMSGYWRRPELSAQRFPRVDGLFPELRTGDYGWLDEEGYLYFTGRRDDLYKANGFRVSAGEVEAAARRVTGVETAVVLPPAPDRPATLFVTGAVRAEEVLLALREQIEDFKIPAHCVVLDALPLTGNGKVDRNTLAAALLTERNLHAG
ncbi:acyl--CoA ligase [Streptomyces sp. MC1]|uniref:class I adenylate-forming enzyme family protein n=1 Tax=Streptomyces sp. MC1 TaxID=295105 RepID=UPI0018CB124C|nr:class I adenylate-forming enzyme family protein [Streptomyces sp. MC1]MBG7704683.1 acyl--CoA ligase [Streptomyces sp. MC1]